MYKLVMKGEGGQKEEIRRRMEVRKYFLMADKGKNFTIGRKAGIRNSLNSIH